MHEHHHTITGNDRQSEDYVTIIGPSLIEVMRQFRERGLGEDGYAIVGRVDRHRFAMADVDGAHELFDGEPMLAATFMRRAAA